MFFNLAAVVFIFLSSLQPIRRTGLDCTSDTCRECFQSRSQRWPRGGVFSQAVALCMRFCESRDAATAYDGRRGHIQGGHGGLEVMVFPHEMALRDSCSHRLTWVQRMVFLNASLIILLIIL